MVHRRVGGSLLTSAHEYYPARTHVRRHPFLPPSRGKGWTRRTGGPGREEGECGARRHLFTDYPGPAVGLTPGHSSDGPIPRVGTGRLWKNRGRCLEFVRDGRSGIPPDFSFQRDEGSVPKHVQSRPGARRGDRVGVEGQCNPYFTLEESNRDLLLGSPGPGGVEGPRAPRTPRSVRREDAETWTASGQKWPRKTCSGPRLKGRRPSVTPDTVVVENVTMEIGLDGSGPPDPTPTGRRNLSLSDPEVRDVRFFLRKGDPRMSGIRSNTVPTLFY